MLLNNTFFVQAKLPCTTVYMVVGMVAPKNNVALWISDQKFAVVLLPEDETGFAKAGKSIVTSIVSIIVAGNSSQLLYIRTAVQQFMRT